MKRDTVLDQIENTREPWDILVIGGGATGLGVASTQQRAGTARCWWSSMILRRALPAAAPNSCTAGFVT